MWNRQMQSPFSQARQGLELLAKVTALPSSDAWAGLVRQSNRPFSYEVWAGIAG